MDFSTTISNIISTTDFSSFKESFQSEVLWILIVGFIVALFLAFGVGANDVANTFGTSVGSKVISLRNACIIATIFELAGACLIGYKVSDTIRKGIVDPEVFKNSPQEFMLGNLSALGASAIWLILATFLKMPISGTHSIVGSVLGFSLVARGTQGINAWKVGSIVLSWFVSPLLSGFVSCSIFYGISRYILKKEDAITPGLRSLPIFYGLTVFINIISILLDGPEMFKIKSDNLPDWTESVFGILISIAISLVVAGVVTIWIVPKLRRDIAEEVFSSSSTTGNVSKEKVSEDEKVVYVNKISPTTPPDLLRDQAALTAPEKPSALSPPYKNGNLNGMPPHPITLNPAPPSEGMTPNTSGTPLIKTLEESSEETPPLQAIFSESDEGIVFKGKKVKDEAEGGDRPGVGKLFSFLQILTAAFGSFAHGGNDVSNAIGPLIALWLVYKEGIVDTVTTTPIWLLVYGGAGISLGLWVWGRRVIKTMGEDLTKITPSSGFTIEIGAAITVLIASKIGIPVSTTHCKVGSVVFVGLVKSSKDGVDWSLFRNIIFAWLVTVPVSGGLSALLMWILTSAVL